MGNLNWANRDRKTISRGHLKRLGKPFRKTTQKDSKQSREWSKLKKRMRKSDQEAEEQINESRSGTRN